MSKIEEIGEKLPKTDCGSCGAPTCMAFAEDIVKGEATADNCTVIMRQLFNEFLNNEHVVSVLKDYSVGADNKSDQITEVCDDAAE